jgi:hypothetical protein
MERSTVQSCLAAPSNPLNLLELTGITVINPV